ncbi:MAG TPA: homoserine dehydrogenase [Desulfobacteraceae bacterium]|nr:homoserine dehydrogenase [Desulfobacteraceae bacterium]
MDTISIGIIGFGTVGAGTYELLTANSDLITRKVGVPVVVKKIADLDTETDRGVPVDPALLTTRASEIIQDPEIDIVVELIGGTGTACELILKAMSAGKHVVTANKALLATHGSRIYQQAVEYGLGFGFEASVGGGIPILGSLRTGLSGNDIQTVMGILNGTSNYILTKMSREGRAYEDVVQEAVRLGFAEDPPDLDVKGIDTAHKLAIITSIILGRSVPLEKIHCEGITFLTPDDIYFAGEFGFCIKLLAIARINGDTLEARVHPAMIPKTHILANVLDAYNAIYLEGDFVGPNLYYGLGAGRKPTASAVVADIIDLSRRICAGVEVFPPPLSHAKPSASPVRVKPIDEHNAPYYFRFSVVDRPGVLSKLSGILGENGISIYSVIQKGRNLNGSVPVVILTHEAREQDVQNALRTTSGLDVLTDIPVMIRVEGSNQ